MIKKVADTIGEDIVDAAEPCRQRAEAEPVDLAVPTDLRSWASTSWAARMQPTQLYPLNMKTRQSLYYTSLCGFHDLASDLIAEHPQYVNTRGGLNHSSLVAALHKRHFNIAKLLLQPEHGAAMDVRGYERQTPFHAASADGLADDYGADANSVQDSLSTPLDMAAANGHLEVIRMLLGNGGVDADAANDDDHTPLHLASENGHLNCAPIARSRGGCTRKGLEPIDAVTSGLVRVVGRNCAATNRAWGRCRFEG